MSRPLLAVATALALTACGEDPAPPNEPNVLSAEAVCRRVEGVFKLDQVTVQVLDLDGVQDLTPPEVLVLATALPMEAAPLDTEAVDPETGEAFDCQGPEGQCVMRYTWRHSDTSEQIYCGEDGTLLEVLFEIDDVAGFWTRVVFTSRAL